MSGNDYRPWLMQSESGAITEWPSAVLERAATHAAGCSQCRQECRESGYYHLHRQLDDPLLLHDLLLSFCHTDSTDFTDFLFFIKNSRIREFFCNDKNFCFAMNLRIVSRRRFFCHTDSTDSHKFLLRNEFENCLPQKILCHTDFTDLTDFLFIKNSRIREFPSLSHSSLATTTIL